MWTKFTFSCLHLKAAALFMGWCICLNECPAIIDFSSLFFFILYDCVTGVVQQKSLTLAHLLTNWLWKELGHALPTVAVVKLRHGFTQATPWSFSFLPASPQFSLDLHLPIAQHNKMPAGCVAPLSYPLSPLPFWYYILLGLCEREKEAGTATEYFNLFKDFENW